MNSVYPSGDCSTVSQPGNCQSWELLFRIDRFYMHSNLCECRSLRLYRTCRFVWAPPQSVAELPHHQASLWLPHSQFHPSRPHPHSSPSSDNHESVLILRLLCKWNHTVCNLWSLAFSFSHSLWIPWDPSELFRVSTARSFSPLSRVSPWEGCTSLFNCSPIGGHLGLLWHPCTCFCVDLGFHFFRMNAQGYGLQSHMVKCMCSLPKLFPQWHFDFSNTSAKTK